MMQGYPDGDFEFREEGANRWVTHRPTGLTVETGQLAVHPAAVSTDYKLLRAGTADRPKEIGEACIDYLRAELTRRYGRSDAIMIKVIAPIVVNDAQGSQTELEPGTYSASGVRVGPSPQTERNPIHRWMLIEARGSISATDLDKAVAAGHAAYLSL